MIDQFGRKIDYMRVSVTDRCNLRCRYCMPEVAACETHDAILRYEEILRVCRAAAELGITKFKVTGGEPLVRRGCADLCRMIAQVPGIREIDLTTNGVLLERYAQALKDAGVTRVNISVDSLDPDKYRDITGGGELRISHSGLGCGWNKESFNGF